MQNYLGKSIQVPRTDSEMDVFKISGVQNMSRFLLKFEYPIKRDQQDILALLEPLKRQIYWSGGYAAEHWKCGASKIAWAQTNSFAAEITGNCR